MNTKLIVFEGTDCSGKSTIAKAIADSHNWVYDHEPTFSSEEADRLNFKDMDCWQREFMFMQDRIKHQEFLNHFDVCLDRYILSGLVYAQVFSPTVLPMMESVYKLKDSFKRPDLNVFIKINPKFAFELNETRKGTNEYNPKLTIKLLEDLDFCFEKYLADMAQYWDVPYVVVESLKGNLPQTIKDTESAITKMVGNIWE